ncbi:MAG TPA: MerR family transcriptional regulator [Leptospiraceae bacterium]|nr:MerR family transcriptional regulator [Spirochaetaceae bacterium]HBS05455.1 MerR family transcriptional regulator [Leptospiraceae bacterium]|tara:strand:- start:36062 stop:36865 length:804 start_codon:yes stop_codon:yes gene_type:complete
MYSIGQFSLISRLSVRTLRKYHEIGLLVPDYVDEDSGYRYYKPAAIERAQVIVGLRDLDFSLKDINTILAECGEDEDILDRLIEQKKSINQELQRIQSIEAGLERTIALVRERQKLPEESGEIEIKEIPQIPVALLYETGAWADIGAVFSRVGRKAGRYIGGPALSLCFDGEYRDEASYAAGFILKSAREIKGLKCETLPRIRCLSVIHTGPYDTIGISYERILSRIQEQKLSWKTPTREIYLRGPGMIFRGNPKKYRTEIQIPLDS